ncbi:undecaprenyl-phosphate glucose phosphotransferase [Maribacter halichondriae]|uniref:undecaprenyl-phosphate glucose phosphotransferase n=1 Tax=Maribacter halichondriae TaxID=2980554 RepID=UPI002359D0BA|nr:undecaprenyl-phosphate glucose phosphotransferase [Maribacter sp. Hal144]
MKNSDLIIPISIAINLAIINGLLYILTPETYLHSFHIIYYNVAWLLITYTLDFYPTDRKERFLTNFEKMIKLYVIFGFVYFSAFGFNQNMPFSLSYQLLVFAVLCFCLSAYRWFFFWARRRYRMLGGNSVNVVVLGKDTNLKKMRQIFEDSYLGYRYKGFFDNRSYKRPDYLGAIEDSFLYMLENRIDEIYCSVSKFSKNELDNLIDFADNNLIKFKIIPDNKEILTRAMSIERYGSLPILNLRKVPLDTDYARITKRIFDIFFSLFAIIFILSWLTPLLAILIRLESSGPVFFKQERHGLKRKVFWCYKFRSMAINGEADIKMTTKNDMRVTRIGRFMRRTSIDELPQFFNVLLGNMSVVGPRPHMMFHTEDYESSVDKYLVRHFVKPGITGLAQIKGYRGEILCSSDIKNRTRFDIFYVERWSMALDLKIILQTIYNAFSQEERAY